MVKVEYNDYSSQVIEAIKEAEQRALLISGILAKGDAILLAPTNKRYNTGGKSLKNNIDYRVEDGRVLVGCFSKHSVYVEKGTGIYAEDHNGRKTPWVYYDNVLNRYFYTEGNEPQPFLMPAVTKNRKKIVQIFEKELAKLGD